MSRRDLTFAIGDVHGRLDLLKPLLEEIELLSGGRPYELVFLGDLIDRGPDSAGVIRRSEHSRRAIRRGFTASWATTRRCSLQQLTTGRSRRCGWRYGGINTLASFKARSPDTLPADVLNWIRALPTFLEEDLRYFVHAGVDPRLPLSRQSDSHSALDPRTFSQQGSRFRQAHRARTLARPSEVRSPPGPG